MHSGYSIIFSGPISEIMSNFFPKYIGLKSGKCQGTPKEDPKCNFHFPRAQWQSVTCLGVTHNYVVEKACFFSLTAIISN